VHDEIGFLDCFRLAENAPHSLSDGERRQLSLANLMATGMNMGLREGSRSFGRGYGLGRLRNAAAHYVYPKTLQASLARLLQEWDRRNYGAIWGTGERCSVDGRVVFSYEKNLVSQYHHRRGRIGVTAYWFVRDDWMASTIRLIGNQEHEAWFILDELLRPSGMKTLKSSCGDTHGQQLALWGLSSLVGKRILARFRGLRGVRLYCSRIGKRLPIRQVHPIRWDLLRRCAGSLRRLGEAVRQGRIPASEVLKTWNIYDEAGRNVGDALRELGKIDRT
jgi:TnpA family transposase